MRRATRAGLLPLLAVGVLLAGAAVAASLATPQLHADPLPKYNHTPGPEPSDKAFRAIGAPPPAANGADTAIHLPSWVGPTLLALVAAVLLSVIGLLVFFLIRGRDRTRLAKLVDDPLASAMQQRAQVLAAVDAGLVELDDGDPRAAVIACWVRLEQAAAAAGTPREPGDTPAELVLRLLAEHDVSSGVLYPLAEVYRLARYATHTVDVGMRDQARAALGQLRTELTSAPVPG